MNGIRNCIGDKSNDENDSLLSYFSHQAALIDNYVRFGETKWILYAAISRVVGAATPNLSYHLSLILIERVATNKQTNKQTNK